MNNTCPLYSPHGNQRFFWYPEMVGGGYWTPTLWVDGIDSVSTSQTVTWWRNTLKSMVGARQPVPSPVELDMSVELGAKADSGTVHVKIVATDTIPFTKLRVRFAIVEDDLMSGIKHYDQVLRTYLPGSLGYAITLSEGDTVDWSEDFEIDPSWVLENCRAVVHLQNGTNPTGGDPPREVAQCIQGPVFVPVPVPDAVADLTVTLSEDDLVLEWSPVTMDTTGAPIVVDSYNVYRDTAAFFEPGSEPFDGTIGLFFVDTTGVVGDTGIHYYYAVTAVAGTKESQFSSLAGEFDYYLTKED